MERFRRFAEVASNIGIIVVAVMLSYFLVARFLSPPSVPLAAEVQSNQLKPGTKVPLKAADWGKKDKNLLMVLSATCRYCTESTTFYQRLVKQNAMADKINIVAVLPQEIEASQKYLAENGVVVNEIIKAAPSEALVRGTPTLILTDGSGTILDSWTGKLPPEAEAELLAKLFD